MKPFKALEDENLQGLGGNQLGEIKLDIPSRVSVQINQSDTAVTVGGLQ